MQEPMIIGSNPPENLTATQRAIGDDIAMQLSSITYCSLKGSKSVENTLKKYFPEMKLVWQPVNEIDGNYAFIALYGVQYIIAIRGSILQFSWASFDNWFKEDFNILYQVPWTYTNHPSTQPMISQGASDGLNSLLGLRDKNGDSMYSFLQKNAFPNKSFLCVTGHSLGGNLCTVFGLWLQYQMQQAGVPKPGIFSILSFAAPTAWNQAFVDQFTAAFTNSWRYYGVLDIVPFSAFDVVGLEELYPPPAPAAKHTDILPFYTLAEGLKSIAKDIRESEDYYHSYYKPVNQHRGSIQLNTAKKLYPDSGIVNLERWFKQASAQHDHNHYLDWMGAGEVNCV